MDPQEARRQKLESYPSERLAEGLASGAIAGRKAALARSILERRREELELAERGMNAFPVPPRSRFRLSESHKATAVLIAQTVAAIATVALAIIAYLTWVSPNLPK